MARGRGRPPKSEPKRGLQVVTSKPSAPPILDYPLKAVPMPRSNGLPSNWSMDIAYLPYLDNIPRTELATALIEEDTPETLALLKLVSDPRVGNEPISVLAGRCSIRVPQMIEIWRRHKMVEALGIAIEGTPQTARDTVIDAQSTTVCCNRCDGAGVIRVQRQGGPEWITCLTCKGTGEVRKPGDPKSREWVLRAGGVIAAESNGPNVNVNFGSTSATSVIEEMERVAVNVSAIPGDDS